MTDYGLKIRRLVSGQRLGGKSTVSEPLSDEQHAAETLLRRAAGIAAESTPRLSSIAFGVMDMPPSLQ